MADERKIAEDFPPDDQNGDNVVVIEDLGWGQRITGPAHLVEQFRPVPAHPRVRRGSFMTRGPGWLK